MTQLSDGAPPGLRGYCAGVDHDGLPAETEPLISEDLREREIEVLQGLLASGTVDLDRFQRALDGLLGARTTADFGPVVRGLPPPFHSLRPHGGGKSAEDLHLDGQGSPHGPLAGRPSHQDMGGYGDVTIDLTEAEFDNWDVKIVVDINMGSLTVIVPRGLDVRQVGRSAAFTSTLQEPIPGFPVVRLSAFCNMRKSA